MPHAQKESVEEPLSRKNNSGKYSYLSESRVTVIVKLFLIIICTAAERSVEEQQSYIASKGVTVVLKPFDPDEPPCHQESLLACQSLDFREVYGEIKAFP